MKINASVKLNWKNCCSMSTNDMRYLEVSLVNCYFWEKQQNHKTVLCLCYTQFFFHTADHRVLLCFNNSTYSWYFLLEILNKQHWCFLSVNCADVIKLFSLDFAQPVIIIVGNSIVIRRIHSLNFLKWPSANVLQPSLAALSLIFSPDF